MIVIYGLPLVCFVWMRLSEIALKNFAQVLLVVASFEGVLGSGYFSALIVLLLVEIL